MIELISDIINITPEDNIFDGRGGYIPSIQDRSKTKVQYETFYESYALGLKILSLLKRSFNNCSMQLKPEIKAIEISVNTSPIIDITYTENLFLPLVFEFDSRTSALTNAITFLGQILVTNSSDLEIIENFEERSFNIHVNDNELAKVKYKYVTQLGAKAAKKAILLGLSPYLSQDKKERAISLAGNYIQYYYKEVKLPKPIQWIDIYEAKELDIKISVKIALNDTNFSPGSIPFSDIKTLVGQAKNVQRNQSQALRKINKKKPSVVDRMAGSRFDHDD
jgi:hypothetical protein